MYMSTWVQFIKKKKKKLESQIKQAKKKKKKIKQLDISAESNCNHPTNAYGSFETNNLFF